MILFSVQNNFKRNSKNSAAKKFRFFCLKILFAVLYKLSRYWFLCFKSLLFVCTFMKPDLNDLSKLSVQWFVKSGYIIIKRRAVCTQQRQKTQRTINTKLILYFCMNGLTIMIGQLGLVQLTNRKTRRKHVNKLISRPLLTLFY